MNARTAVAEKEFAAPQATTAPSNPKPLAVVPPPREVSRIYPAKIAKALLAITREFGAIAKTGVNSFHNYKYQKWEDILERESILLTEHNIFLQQSEIARTLLDKLVSITYEFTIINDDGDVWPDKPVFTAIARLIDSKGIFDDKAANKCHTQAHKYFLLNEFKIRTKETAADDSDNGHDEVAPKQGTKGKPPKPGSAEAKALEGPREINGNGPDGYADNFIAAIATATSIAELDQWIEPNLDKLGRLENYPAHKRTQDAITKRRAELAPKKAKPPKPAAPKKNTMPDPSSGAVWLTWLTEKFATFETYEQGETYWNDIVEALDLPRDVHEEAMGVWGAFEARFAP